MDSAKDETHRKRRQTKPILPPVRNETTPFVKYDNWNKEDDDSDDEKSSASKSSKAESGHIMNYICFCVLIAVVIFLLKLVWVWAFRRYFGGGFDLNKELSLLENKYPEQEPVLWERIQEMLTLEKPAAEIIMLLYSGNDVTPRCLAQDISRMINLKHSTSSTNDVIMFQNKDFLEDDPLAYYKDIVNKNKHIVVLKLNEMPGRKAMIFHYLCNKDQQTAIPSYFIFTVENAVAAKKDDNKTFTNLKPVIHSILRQAWKDLGEKTQPLINRVAQYIYEVKPEKMSNCI